MTTVAIVLAIFGATVRIKYDGWQNGLISMMAFAVAYAIALEIASGGMQR